MSVEFDRAIADVRARDPRYARDAYLFVFEALAHTQRTLSRQKHVTGQELLEGIRALAIEQFGFLARTVFHEWGCRTTTDFGHLVFNLVGANLMGKQDTDTLDDFRDRYDFAQVFERDFRLEVPAAVAAEPAAEPEAEPEPEDDADPDESEAV